jgi:hypothetical protein
MWARQVGRMATDEVAFGQGRGHANEGKRQADASGVAVA